MITTNLLQDYLEEYKQGMHPIEFLLDMIAQYCSQRRTVTSPVNEGVFPLVLSQVAELKEIAQTYIYEGVGGIPTISDTGIARILEKYESYKQ